LEAKIMKKCLISIGVALVVLAVAWPVLGQREGGQGREGQRRFQDMSEEERAKLRERWQNMSEEEREKLRAQMSERFGSRGPRMGREEQLKAIKVIEQQAAKLKAGIEARGPSDRTSFRDLSEEERAKLRETFAKAREERQKAIRAILAQLAALQGQRQPAEGEQYLIISTGQLKPISELAAKEKAKETAQRLERLIRGGRRGFGGRPPGSRPSGTRTP